MPSSRAKNWFIDQFTLLFVSLLIAKFFELLFSVETLNSAQAFIEHVHDSFPTFVPQSMDDIALRAAAVNRILDSAQVDDDAKNQLILTIFGRVLRYIWPNNLSIFLTFASFVISSFILDKIEKRNNSLIKILIRIFASTFAILLYLDAAFWLLNTIFSHLVPLVTYALFPSLGISIYWCIGTVASDSLSGRLMDFLKKKLKITEGQTS